MQLSFQRWVLFSTVASAALIVQYFTMYKDVYTSLVNLSASNWTLVVIGNQFIVISVLLGMLFKLVFFGKLSTIEVETLSVRTRYEAVDLLFSLTFFRMDNFYTLILWLLVILFLKVFHWLLYSRIEWIDQAPGVPMKFHIRVNACFAVLFITDAILVRLCFSRTQSAQMFYLFSFQYAVIIAELVSHYLKYFFAIIDRRMEGGWAKKDLRLLELDVVFSLYKFVVYVSFLILMVYDYMIPILLIRNVYRASRQLSKNWMDLKRYNRTLRLLDDTFHRMDEEETSQLDDRTCVICREEITTGVRLPCMHAFHDRCIRSWLARQHVCPTCRANVTLNEDGAIRARVREMIENELEMLGQPRVGINNRREEIRQAQGAGNNSPRTGRSRNLPNRISRITSRLDSVEQSMQEIREELQQLSQER